jgi:hypothetical protein
MNSDVGELLAALRSGTLTLDEVARRFRHRSWPHSNGPDQANYVDLATAAEQDPDPYVPGSFDEVAAAYRRGELSRSDYRTLARAAAESSWAEDSGE